MSIALAGVVTSCDMDAPTQSTLDESSVFSQYSLAESEIMSIHVSFCQTNSYRGRFLPYYGLNSDLETGSGTQPSYSKAMSYDDKNSLWAYNTLATNGQMPMQCSTRVSSVQTLLSMASVSMAISRTTAIWLSFLVRL